MDLDLENNISGNVEPKPRLTHAQRVADAAA
jgi:hypothetical protein